MKLENSDRGENGAGVTATGSGRRGLLSSHESALLALARFEAKADDIDVALRIISEVAARTLGVERVGIWVFDDERTKITCLNQFVLSDQSHSKGQEFFARDAPNYFLALEENRALAAHDVMEDFRTAELVEPYLVPLGIVSMLDAPIRKGGRVVGIVCHEHCGSLRVWSPEEQNFASSIADMAALSLEHCERVRAEEEVRRRDQLLDGVARAANRMFADAEGELIARDEMLRCLADAAHALAFASEAEAAVDDALDDAVAVLRLDRASLYMVSSRAPGTALVRWRARGGSGPGAPEVAPFDAVRLLGAATEATALFGRPRQFRPGQSDEGADELSSVVLAPIAGRDGLLGCLELGVQHSDEREWLAAELMFARTLAALFRSALETKQAKK